MSFYGPTLILIRESITIKLGEYNLNVLIILTFSYESVYQMLFVVSPFDYVVQYLLKKTYL